MIAAIILNLIPADVTRFTITEGEQGKETIHLTKQADGGWKMADGPKGDMGTLYVDGSKLTVKNGGKKQMVDLFDRLDIDKDADWSKLKTLKLSGTTLKIERKPNGLDLRLQDAKKDEGLGKLVKVRWEKNKKE